MTTTKKFNRANLLDKNVYLIDNYDSFTFNLFQYLKELGIEKLSVVRNNAISAEQLFRQNPDLIVVSPGPSTPENAGISLQIMEQAAKTLTPTFGVCLGLQCMAEAFGGKIIRCDPPMHGKVSKITHDQTGIYREIPSPFTVTRYHSLKVDKSSLPKCLQVTAESEDGCLMSLKHLDAPLEAVQFHPEAVLTEYGHKILLNFLESHLS